MGLVFNINHVLIGENDSATYGFQPLLWLMPPYTPISIHFLHQSLLFTYNCGHLPHAWLTNNQIGEPHLDTVLKTALMLYVRQLYLFQCMKVSN